MPFPTTKDRPLRNGLKMQSRNGKRPSKWSLRGNLRRHLKGCSEIIMRFANKCSARGRRFLMQEKQAEKTTQLTRRDNQPRHTGTFLKLKETSLGTLL